MIWAWWTFALVALVYAGLWLFVAQLAERGKLPEKLVSHPLVHIAAFGASCSSWTFYGSVGMAYEFQHGYLAFYVGLAILLLFSAFIIRPIFSLANSYQLSSLADLFAFRYRSRWIGLVTAAAVLISVLPLLALQIQAVTDVISLLDTSANSNVMALLISGLLASTTIYIGTRNVKPSEEHPGLLFALGTEAIIKLLIFLIIGALALFQISGGFPDLQRWLVTAPTNFSNLNPQIQASQWFALVLMFIAAPLALPHLFQILFRESDQSNRLRLITWAAPIYLLFMALPVLPILWAGIRSGSALNPEYFTLAIGQVLASPTVILLTYVGGLTAAFGITLVAVLSISSMLLHHFVLPFQQPKRGVDLYHWLLSVRRVVILAMFSLVFATYLLLNQVHNQTTLLITSYSGLLQLGPGIIGLLFWSRANRQGFVAGVIGGFLCWLIFQLAPVINDSLSLSERLPLQFSLDRDAWTELIFLSLGVNTALFILVSLFTRTSPEELRAAQICSVASVERRQRLSLKAKSAQAFIDNLGTPLGSKMAEQEVRLALRQLHLDIHEHRQSALRQLRDKIEANLSGMMGPSVAEAIVSRYLPFDRSAQLASDDFTFLEHNLDNYHYQLTGMSAELDRLRRHHRDTLHRLPIGVCSLSLDGEVLMWNREMTELTGIPETEALGSNYAELQAPWGEMIQNFLASNEEKIITEHEGDQLNRGKRWLSLHQSRTQSLSNPSESNIILLLDDETENKMLETELMHSERLASIGRLAAGVAHEIGNPITGIDCLAQDLKYAKSAQDIHDIAQQIRHEANRVTRIVRSLVNFSHSGQSEHHAHDIRIIVQDAIDLLSLSRESKEVNFINEVANGIEVLCDPQRLSQVFINLLANARDASNAQDDVLVDAQIDQETLLISITDSGTGIRADYLDHIFEPFFTTKGVGKGTGLGLFLSYTIVEEHFGQISVKSPVSETDGVGTRFTIQLPLHANVTSGNT